MVWRRILLPFTIFCTLLFAIMGFSQVANAQSPTYGVGKTPTPEEIRAWDISVSPEGKELPPGHGTAKQGAQVYLIRGCGACHGVSGSEGPAPTLIKSDGKTKSVFPCLTPCVNDSNVMALHAPYATTIWDYIKRAMPLNSDTLKPDEVYALTAFLLYKNGVIKEEDVMDQQTLPKVQMPNRKGAGMPPDWKHGTPRLAGYP
jgi:S-disulfanyl-L-cysteine oxidoreductase SoxD